MADAPNTKAEPRKGGWLIPAVALLALAGVGGGFAALQTEPGKRWLAEVTTTETALPIGCRTDRDGPLAIGGPISLIDKNAQPVTSADIAAGGPSIVYFGFTSCPSECPITMRTWTDTLDILRGQDIKVSPVFISFDFNADKTDVIDTFTEENGFPADLLALTGATQAQTDAAVQAFKVTALARNDPGGALGQNWTHSSFVYIMDETWTLRGFYTSIDNPNSPVQTASPQGAAACIKAALRQR